MQCVIAKEVTGTLETGGEARVALTPEAAQRLKKAFPTLEILVEEGAGTAAGFPDAAYKAAGATPTPAKKLKTLEADLHLRLAAPTGPLPLQKDGLLICLNPGAQPVQTLALEKLPRTSRAQAMDVLSSQANLAGYAAVLAAARHLPRLLPMLMTAAGASRPAQVLVLGVGVAGLQAIATARRLGAQVQAYDLRPEVQEQILSLGAKPVSVPAPAKAGEGQNNGGYARELTAEEQKAQQKALMDAILAADLVITTAQVPGRPAPVLVPENAVKNMKPGSVLLDMAAGGYNRANGIRGGNCPLSVADETVVTAENITILAPTNLASTVAGDASRFFANNLVNLLNLVLKQQDSSTIFTFEDELVKAMHTLKPEESKNKPSKSK